MLLEQRQEITETENSRRAAAVLFQQAIRDRKAAELAHMASGLAPSTAKALEAAASRVEVAGIVWENARRAHLAAIRRAAGLEVAA